MRRNNPAILPDWMCITFVAALALLAAHHAWWSAGL